MEVTTAERYATGGEAPELYARNLALAFARTVERVGDDPAIRDPERGVELSWIELAQRTARIAGGLAKLGVGKGDAVALLMSNRWEFIVALHTRMQELGVVPEFEIFDLGHLWSLERLLDRYGLPAGGHVHVDLVMGVPGGMPGTAEALVACVSALRNLPEGTTFSATGIGRTTLPVMLASLSAGGHLRVGMEDTLSYAHRQPVESNAQLVRRAAELARLAQRPPLTPDQARELLGIPAPAGR